MKSARFGEQSREPVISAWGMPSSKGTTVYEIQLHSDGVLTCNCPGWVSRASRDCKHVKAKIYEAHDIMAGRKPHVFEKYDLPSNTQVIAPTPKREGRHITMD